MFNKVILALFAVCAIMVCSVCGSDSHRVQKCTHPAADEIKKLRAKVKQLTGAVRSDVKGSTCINVVLTPWQLRVFSRLSGCRVACVLTWS